MSREKEGMDQTGEGSNNQHAALPSTETRPSTFMSRIYHPLGFTKGHNFGLFVVFAGALMGFTLARLPFLDIDGVFCSNSAGLSPATSATRHAAPGECFYYSAAGSLERVGIIIHLATVLPAAFLACFQFVPAIRRRWPAAHKANGYAVLLLSTVGAASAFLVARRAFGGTLATQTGVGLLGIAFLASLALAYANIRRRQIEQHRAWMLRAWFYAGSIVTARLIMFLAAYMVTAVGGYYMAEPCAKVASLVGGRDVMLARYPECAAFYSGANPDQHALVTASMTLGRAESVGAAIDLNFGAAMWLALALHAVGIEIYLHLTPAEAERLRQRSYQRQLESGMLNPGQAGLTADRLGDADKWRPDASREGAQD
ncbi:hypothetical protein RB595_002086 [Gaeumannomyces hyphopodioides]